MDYIKLLTVTAKQLKNKIFHDWITIVGFLFVIVLVNASFVSQMLGFQSSDTTDHLIEKLAVATPPLSDDLIDDVKSYFDFYFWSLLCVSAFLGFWVVDVFYRQTSAKIYAQLPFSPSARYLERSTLLFLSVILGALICAGRVFSVSWSPDFPHLFFAVASFICLSLFSTVLCCIGANNYVGVHYASPNSGGSASDAYGGPGGALLYAPAIGFGLSTVVIFVYKLAFQEVLRAGMLSNAAMVAGVGGIVISIVVYLGGYRAYKLDGNRLNAWFNEYDSVGFQSVVDYQKSSWPDALSTWQLRFLRLFGFGHEPRLGTVANFKRLNIEYGRCYPFDRIFRILGALATIVLSIYLTEKSAFFAVLILIWLYGALIEPVWSRIVRLESNCDWILETTTLAAELRDGTIVFCAINLARSSFWLLLATLVSTFGLNHFSVVVGAEVAVGVLSTALLQLVGATLFKFSRSGGKSRLVSVLTLVVPLLLWRFGVEGMWILIAIDCLLIFTQVYLMKRSREASIPKVIS